MNLSAMPTVSELEQLTRPGTAIGTITYMSPEQVRGEDLDSRTDLFSFGAVLYEMVTGVSPFRGETSGVVAEAILNRRPVAPVRLNPDLSSNLEEVINKALEKDRKLRYQHAADMRTDLQRLKRDIGTGRIGIVSSGSMPVGRESGSQPAVAEADREPGRREQRVQPSIAVLPFANMSRDAADDYFSDGLAEEILNALTQVQGLKVIARTSAFAFRGKEQDIREIAKTLGVSNVLEGSVRRAGNRLRITAQLIQAADGTHLWSQRYDRDMIDVFAIQDEISQAISEALKVRLAPRARTVNIEAYQYYLKGQYHRVRFTPESLAKAKDCFEQALAIDPNCAPASSGLAGYYCTLAVLGMKPAGDMWPLVKSAAEKALAVDPANSEAHSLLAVMAASFDYHWKVAETHHRKAMAAEPVPPLVRSRYAVWYLLPLGRVAEAMEQNRLALETDPLSMLLHYSMAISMACAKQYLETIEYARRALEIDANFYYIWFAMGLAQLGAGFAQEAVTSFKRVVELAPWFHMGAGFLAAAYRQAGDRERNQEWVRTLAGPHSQSLGAAIYYAAAGEVDAMFEALNEAHRQRDVFLVHIRAIQTLLPFFDHYLSDPRFQDLLQRMNLA
jgi:serine/threonine-protein kinase